MTTRRARLWIVASVVALGVSFALATSIGAAGPSSWHAIRGLFGGELDDVDRAIVFDIRLPRIVLAGLVGSMLSVAGASYQGVFRNPLVDPYLLGVAAGAGLGATAIFAAGRDRFSSWPISPVPAVAFFGGLVAVALTYAVGVSFGGATKGSSANLVLAGVAVTSLFTAVQTYVLQRNNDVIREVYTWILGRLTTATWADVRLVLPYVLGSFVILLMHRRQLDLLRVGEVEAASLGVDVARIRLTVVVVATLGTAAAVSVSGLIGFVGVVVPHVIRLLVGSTYRLILPLSLVLGATFVIIADLLGRTLISPAELPIGVVTAFVGAPFFMVLLLMRRVES